MTSIEATLILNSLLIRKQTCDSIEQNKSNDEHILQLASKFKILISITVFEVNSLDFDDQILNFVNLSSGKSCITVST